MCLGMFRIKKEKINKHKCCGCCVSHYDPQHPPPPTNSCPLKNNECMTPLSFTIKAYTQEFILFLTACVALRCFHALKMLTVRLLNITALFSFFYASPDSSSGGPHLARMDFTRARCGLDLGQNYVAVWDTPITRVSMLKCSVVSSRARCKQETRKNVFLQTEVVNAVFTSHLIDVI